MTRSIRLVNLTLRQFKGVESFDLSIDGRSAVVRGDNATGKTTLHDAYTWLLFGKDHQNRAVFEIKPLDDHGVPASGVDHSVEGAFDVDGTVVVLSRTYSETWTKRRGSTTAELTGHKTEYRIDGVPVKQREYQDRVRDLFAPEDVLRLITDPLYFASVLPWADRRSRLLSVVGDVTDEDIIKAQPDLADLPGILGKRTPDEHRKVLEARRREINTELTRLPIRIDELTRRAEAADIPDDLDDLFRAASDRLDALTTEHRAAVAAAGDHPDVRRNRIQDQIDQITRSLALSHREAIAEAQAKVDDVRRRLTADQGHLTTADREIERMDRQASSLAEQIDVARSDWRRLRQVDPVGPRVEGVCPCCHRHLDADSVEVAQREADARAKRDVAEQMRQIQIKGQELTRERDDLAKHIATHLAHQQSMRASVDALTAEAQAAEDALTEIRSTPPDPMSDPDVARLTAERDAITNDVPVVDPPADLPVAKADLERLGTLVFARDALARDRARLDELRASERDLAAEVEQIDRHLYLIGLLTRTRAQLLTDRINAAFGVVQFRLFDEQINGALVEVCDVTVDGVPWGDLNHGARMNAGIDIIRTLARHEGVSAPVWLDNAESVTRWIDVDAQTLRLVVDESAAGLTVEVV